MNIMEKCQHWAIYWSRILGAVAVIYGTLFLLMQVTDGILIDMDAQAATAMDAGSWVAYSGFLFAVVAVLSYALIVRRNESEEEKLKHQYSTAAIIGFFAASYLASKFFGLLFWAHNLPEIREALRYEYRPSIELLGYFGTVIMSLIMLLWLNDTLKHNETQGPESGASRKQKMISGCIGTTIALPFVLTLNSIGLIVTPEVIVMCAAAGFFGFYTSDLRAYNKLQEKASEEKKKTECNCQSST